MWNLRKQYAQLSRPCSIFSRVPNIFICPQNRVERILLETGQRLWAKCTIVTTGTCLNAKVHIGDKSKPCGRSSEHTLMNLLKPNDATNEQPRLLKPPQTESRGTAREPTAPNAPPPPPRRPRRLEFLKLGVEDPGDSVDSQSPSCRCSKLHANGVSTGVGFSPLQAADLLGLGSGWLPDGLRLGAKCASGRWGPPPQRIL